MNSEVALAALATLLGATLQSATGFGFALILGPALFAAFEPIQAVTILLILGAALSLLMLFTERRPREIRRRDLRPVLLAAIPGLIAGGLILSVLSKPALQVSVGVAVLLAVLFHARGAEWPAEGRSASTPLRAGVGLLTGILTTTTNTNGPPLVLLFARLGFTPAQQRDSLAAAFLVLDVLGGIVAAPYLLSGRGISSVDVGLLLLFTTIGQLAGRRLFRRLDPATFRAAGLVLVILAGMASIVAGVAG